MTLLHSGGSKRYGDNWARAFGEPESAPKKRVVAKSDGSPKSRASNKKIAVKKSAKKKK